LPGSKSQIIYHPQQLTLPSSCLECKFEKLATKSTAGLQHIQKQLLKSIYIKTMEQNQQQNPNEPDFLKSLNELEEILQENPPLEETATTPEATKIDLATWEDAVADIEQFFESQKKNNQTPT
jgi:predicted RND superfamily exporter protein